jgi:hypothetical protein
MRTAGLLTTVGVFVLALGAASAPATELSQTISKVNHLMVLNRLSITRDQLDQLLPLAEHMTTAVNAWKSDRQKLLADNQGMLSQARRTMVTGRALSDETETALDDLEKALEENDDKLYAAGVEVLDKVREQLFPNQNAFIDWTPPRGKEKGSRDAFLQQVQRQREYRAMVLFAEQFLTRVRYYPLEQYILQAQRVVDDFLRPLIPPDSPAYPQAQQFMFRLAQEVRLLPEAQWLAQSRNYATTLVDGLGLYEPPKQSTEKRPYTWQDMYDIFADPGTPDTLRDIKAALAQG